MKMSDMTDAPGEVVAIDYSGPYSDGRCIVSIVDYYSRFMVARVVNSTKWLHLEPVLNAVREQRLGRFRAIKSDKGSPFNSTDYYQYCVSNNITPFFASPKYARQNGLVEQYMQVINKAMAIAKIEGISDYGRVLAKAIEAHNSTNSRNVNFP